MEAQLQALINKIKSEGIEQAQREADDIRGHAKKEADDILRNAREEARKIVNTAKEEKQLAQNAGTQALAQAGRNLLISLRTKIIALFDELLQADIAAALTVSTLKTMLEKIAQNWQHDKHQGLEILLNIKDLTELEKEAVQKLRNKFHDGILLRPIDTVDKGFFIGEKNKSTYYDFTDRGLAEMLAQYLNPRLSELLREQTAEQK